MTTLSKVYVGLSAVRRYAVWRWLGSKAVAPYLYVAPFFILFITLWLAPILAMFGISFTAWNGIGAIRPNGLANYARMLGDPTFYTALKNTLVFTFVYNALLITLATALAVALDSRLVRWKGFFRSAYFAPVTVSLAVTAMLFDVILGREFGMLNMLLRAVGLPGRTHWLGDPDLALYAFIGLRLWRSTGYYAAIILAGLQSIPGDFLDAAKVDGAGRVTSFFRITLPLLQPTMLFVVVTSTIVSLQVFDEPWILNQGGPANSTLSLVMYIYAQGFNALRLGYGSALSIVFTLILLVFAAVEMKLLGREVE